MKTLNLWCIAFISLCVVSCGENPFESTTYLGSEIIDDYAPTITDFDRNFKTVQFDLTTLSPTTIPVTTQGIAAGLQGEEPPYVGIWENQNEQAVTYLEFDGQVIRNILDTLSLDSLRLRVSFADEIADLQLFVMPDTLTQDVSYDTVPTAEALATFTASSPDSNAVFSLGTDFVSAIDELLQPVDDTVSQDIALVLSSNSPLVELQSVDNSYARLVFTSVTSDTTTDSITLTPEKIRFSVFTLQPYEAPVSSRATDRVAVFPIVLTPLWDAMEGDTSEVTYQSVLAAEMTLEAESVVDKGALDSAVNVLFALERSDYRELDDVTYLDESVRITPDSLRHTVRIEPALNRFLRQEQQRPDTAYLHLRVSSQTNEMFSKVIWQSENSFPFTAVLSTPR